MNKMQYLSLYRDVTGASLAEARTDLGEAMFHQYSGEKVDMREVFVTALNRVMRKRGEEMWKEGRDATARHFRVATENL